MVALPCAPDPECEPATPVWSPNGKRLVFVLRAPKTTHRFVYETDPNGGTPRKLVDFEGTIGDPRFSNSGELAVLATAGAHKEIGATQPGAPIVGVIGGDADEQRIAIVGRDGKLVFASPPDLFVYEYGWRPSGGFVGTAAHGNGDNNWWIARLYAFASPGGTPQAHEIYAPSEPQQQIANPRVSPDGRSVAFIGGLMSDFGSTGGDVYTVPIGGGTATDETTHFQASATSLAWSCSATPSDVARLEFGVLRGGEMELDGVTPAPQAAAVRLRSFGETNVSNITRACAGGVERLAFVRQTFETPPEIYVTSGNDATPVQLTHVNDGLAASTVARSVAWKSDGAIVHGWLLAPVHVDTSKKHPLIMSVHGGPAAAALPRFIARGTERQLLSAGYYIFYPNPRGSFGGGESFTRGNVEDFGYGDLRDDLAGIDAAEKAAPIDDARLGIMGGSYGGFMSMWAVTQTHRFKASVASAGIANWVSYYGENGIDEWMIPYFGASVYDDPGVYRKSSPIEFIKRVTTPSLILVGERDVECPPPQSQEYWHALDTLGVPTQLVIYAGEGHGLRQPKDRADAMKRTVQWFDRYLMQHAS
ncbi:MAG: S9 family peptidase [Candidatus Eremiobacteraeota bacterium]|nr:S9 family peptidase [Candidatus Eremiobacteraeota bacterium]